MRSLILFLLLAVIGLTSIAQTVKPEAITIDTGSYENVHIEKISEDSLHSSYVIWVKHGVKPHYHQRHTEIIIVLEGEGTMAFNDSSFTVSDGDYLVIPPGTVHSVVTTSETPLKVISIQMPKFDGDRIWIDPKTP